MSFKNLDELVTEQKQKSSNFSELLNDLSSLDDKKKILWQQIYDHAIEDRGHAYMLFTDLYISTQGHPAEHQLNGPVLAKYIERMSRANDQMLKLAEQIQACQESQEQIDTDDIFDKIGKKN